MTEFLCRVQAGPGIFVEIPVRAQSFGLALRQIESLYGAGSFLGVLSETQIS